MMIRRWMIHGGERLDGRVEASGTITRNGRLRCIADMTGKEGKQGVARASRPSEAQFVRVNLRQLWISLVRELPFLAYVDVVVSLSPILGMA